MLRPVRGPGSVRGMKEQTEGGGTSEVLGDERTD